jgi:hypothetical protein
VLEEDPQDGEIIARVAALDIGKAEVVCCVRVPHEDKPGRRCQEAPCPSPRRHGESEQCLGRSAGAAVGPYPGFRVSFWLRLVGMRGAAAGDHEGAPRPHWPRTLWLNTVMSLAVGLECVFLIFMDGRRLT